MIMFAPFKTVRATFARTRRVRSRLCTVDARAQSSTSLNFSGSYRHGPERGTVRKPSPGDASSDNVSAHVAGADEARDLITTARQRRDRPAQVVQIDRLLQKRVTAMTGRRDFRDGCRRILRASSTPSMSGIARSVMTASMLGDALR